MYLAQHSITNALSVLKLHHVSHRQPLPQEGGGEPLREEEAGSIGGGGEAPAF
jgi:hypothetical protein